jgi:hypothetical protein
VLAGDDADWPGTLCATFDVLPASEIELLNHDANWRYRKVRPERGTWVYDEDLPPVCDVFAYVTHVNRLDLTRDALDSLGDLWPSLVLVDHSPDGLAHEVLEEFHGKVNVFRMHPSVSFTQLQNWAIAEARARKARAILWMHNDAHCPVGTATDLIATLEDYPAAGVLHTNYDALCLFRMAALDEIGPWDETWTWYASDHDLYHRLRLQQWQIATVLPGTVRHTPSQTIAADQALRQAQVDRALWTRDHYRHKWGGDPGQERFTIPYNGHCRPYPPVPPTRVG